MKTQYGFRARKSTAQAIFIAPRLMDLSERQGTNLSLILLDWEKAFDRVNHKKLTEALRRLCLPPHILNTISNIYTNAQFRVVKGENRSAYYR